MILLYKYSILSYKHSKWLHHLVLKAAVKMDWSTIKMRVSFKKIYKKSMIVKKIINCIQQFI